MTLSNRERFIRTLAFQDVDRLPMIEWCEWWDKTIDRWVSEGFKPTSYHDLRQTEAIQLQMGLDLHMQVVVGITTVLTPKPAHFGAPVVETMDDYMRIRPTLYPEHPFNPSRMKAVAARQKKGEAIAWISLRGPFWGPRELLGIEPHLYAFFDEPELMHTINQDISDYNRRVYEQVCEYYVPDFMTFLEDMSYNNGPMISEALFDEFLLPYYRQQIPAMRERGTRVFIDSDGDITLALPWFARASIEGILPLERQAGVDIAKLRKMQPEYLFIGHYDKMVMPHGEDAMRAEFERLLPVMRQGGFIPSMDHQTPPGVSLKNYHIYLKLLREYAHKALM